MPSTTPFVNPENGTLDTDQILSEAIPLGKLIVVFVAVSLVPFVLGVLILESSPIGAVLLLGGQFILAVGTGIVLMYVIARGMSLTTEPEPES